MILQATVEAQKETQNPGRGGEAGIASFATVHMIYTDSVLITSLDKTGQSGILQIAYEASGTLDCVPDPAFPVGPNYWPSPSFAEYEIFLRGVGTQNGKVTCGGPANGHVLSGAFPSNSIFEVPFIYGSPLKLEWIVRLNGNTYDFNYFASVSGALSNFSYNRNSFIVQNAPPDVSIQFP